MEALAPSGTRRFKQLTRSKTNTASLVSGKPIRDSRAGRYCGGGQAVLVLARRVGEVIKIGENIYVRIVSVVGQQVRVGIDAPREVVILRGELLEESDKLRFPGKEGG